MMQLCSTLLEDTLSGLKSLSTFNLRNAKLKTILSRLRSIEGLNVITHHKSLHQELCSGHAICQLHVFNHASEF